MKIVDSITYISYHNGMKRGIKMEKSRKRIIFHGDLQGIGFRYKTSYLAQSLGLTGWVKNEYDGTVHMEVQGSEKDIIHLVMDLKKEETIRIESMDIEPIPCIAESGFSIL